MEVVKHKEIIQKRGKHRNPNSLANLKKGTPIQKGETRNPSGRPILERTIRKLLEERDLEKIKAFVANLYKQAMPREIEKVVVVGGSIEKVKYMVDGDMTAAQILIERGYGRVPQEIDANLNLINLTDALALMEAKAAQLRNREGAINV